MRRKLDHVGVLGVLFCSRDLAKLQNVLAVTIGSRRIGQDQPS